MGLVNTGSTSINFGSSLRIGYRQAFSAGPFTYLSHFPSYDELPYNFNISPAGQYEIEYTEICPNCSGGIYSDPIIVQVNVLS